MPELQRHLGFACLVISHDLQDYTRRLLAAVSVADPVLQRERRRAWDALEAARV